MYSLKLFTLSLLTLDIKQNNASYIRCFNFMHSLMNSLNDIEISLCAIYKKTRNLKPEKSPDVDSIYPAVLRNSTSVLSIPLCSIYQQSIEFNVIPED